MNPEEPRQDFMPVPQQTEAKAVTKFTAEHGKEVGLPSPEAINYMLSVAKLLLDSSLITSDMGTTVEKVRANALAKMLVGHELGMQPMEALQDIDIVRGKVFVRYPQLINQLILRGFNIKWVERSNERAAIRLTHKSPEIEPEEFEYTIADAKMAGLVTSDSQYHKRPRVMLAARVVSEAYRATGGRSNVYTPEERTEIMGGNGNHQPERTQPAEPEADPYAVVLPEPPAAPAASNGKIPTLEKTPEAHELQAEGPDTSARAGAGSSAPGQQPGETGGAAAAAPFQAGTGNGATAEFLASATAAAPETAKVTAMPKPKIDSRVGPLMAEIEKSLSAKSRKKIVEEYLRGYFGVGDVKSVLGDLRMFDALRNLQALSTSDQWKTPLAGDPHKMGVDAAAGCGKLFSYMEGWPEDCQETAFKIALARYPDDPGALAEYLQDPIQAETLGFGDLRAFLWTLGRVGPTHATMLRERAGDLAEAAGRLQEMPDNATMLLAIEALPESEQQPNLLDMLRKGAE